MNQIRIFLLLFGLLFFAFGSSNAQSKNSYDRRIVQDIGVSFGTAYYLGDINPRKHFGTRLQPSFGGNYRINFDRRWALKFSLLQGRVEAYDADSDDPWQLNRNLSFRNDFTEGSLVFELNFWEYEIGQGKKYFPVAPYFFAGLAYYKMKPQGLFNSTWYELQPLGTEGQGINGNARRYKTTGISIPFGVGVKVDVYKIIGFSLEWGLRKTWTDYFDDVSGIYPNEVVLEDQSGDLAVYFSDQSLNPQLANGTNNRAQRGDPGRKDWYAFAHATLSFRLTKQKGSCWGGKNYK